jgi:hypothetical protein
MPVDASATGADPFFEPSVGDPFLAEPFLAELLKYAVNAWPV